MYPAYVKAHEDIFEGGDVEKGALREAWGKKRKGLRVLTPLEGEEEMTEAFAQSCTAIMDACRQGAGATA